MAEGVIFKFEHSLLDAKLKAAMAAAPALATRALFTSAHAVLIPALRSEVKEQGLVFRGEYIQRLAARASLSSKVMSPQIDVGSLGTPYGTALEYGTEPRDVDEVEYAKLVDWVVKKLKVRDIELANTIARRIADRIEAEGNIAHPHLEKTWEAVRPAFWSDFRTRFFHAFGKKF